MKSPNIIIFTGTDCRHKYFINQLNANFAIKEIFLEKGSFPLPAHQSEDESIAWDWFFQRRNHYEEKLLQDSSHLIAKNQPTITNLDHGELNSPSTLAKIRKASPGFIAVFGTSIIGESLLNEFPNYFFNLHIGDPEFYRGSSCNFWPVYQEKLHLLSATIHRIDQSIDTGEIVMRKAVTLNKDDNDQTLLLKPLILGTQLMVDTMQEWDNDSLNSAPPLRTGKLYKKADFNSKVLLNFKQMVESGRLKRSIQISMDKTLTGIDS
jgi:methionyl-tRNA formyltransferase